MPVDCVSLVRNCSASCWWSFEPKVASMIVHGASGEDCLAVDEDGCPLSKAFIHESFWLFCDGVLVREELEFESSGVFP